MIKKCLFIFLITLFFIEAAICAQNISTRKDIEKGVQLFKSGQVQQSYNLFLELFNEFPDDVILNFYLGRSALVLGHHEMAIMAYERVLIVSPFEYRVKLEIARAFHALGANNTARQYCFEVLDSQPPDTVKKNINLFLAAIDRSEQIHFLKGQISLGVDWNNNVWATPTTTNIATVIGNINLTGASSKETQDWIYNTTLSLSHDYRPLGTPLSWNTDATFYKAIYDKTSALDLQYAGGQTGPEWRVKNVRYGIKVLLSHIDLDNEEYMNSTGLSASIDYAFTPSTLGRARYRFESKEFPGNATRDAKNQSLSFDLNFPVSTAWCSIGLQLEKEKAFDDEYSYNRIQSSLSISRQIGFNILAMGRYKFAVSEYDEPESLFTQKREDNQHTLGASLIKSIWQSRSNKNQRIDMNLNYQHTWAFSNIELYEYGQDLLQIFLTYHF